jgi:hypothetical protein
MPLLLLGTLLLPWFHLTLINPSHLAYRHGPRTSLASLVGFARIEVIESVVARSVVVVLVAAALVVYLVNTVDRKRRPWVAVELLSVIAMLVVILVVVCLPMMHRSALFGYGIRSVAAPGGYFGLAIGAAWVSVEAFVHNASSRSQLATSPIRENGSHAQLP